MTERCLYDSHMHTPLCKHAKGKPEEYAAVAEKRRLKGIIFTCHNPGPKGWSERVRMSLAELDSYVEMVLRAKEKWHGRIDIRLGLESDFVPGIEPFLEKLHGQAPFEYILGSVHPQLPYYKDTYYDQDVLAYQQLYFEHLAQAAESGLFDCLAHPDLVKNVFPEKWDWMGLMDETKRSLDRIADTGIAMELNTSGKHKRIREMNPHPAMLTEMAQRDIPVVLGSDAHAPKRVAADFEQALDLLQEAGYREITYFLERRPYTLPIPEARASLNANHPIPFFGNH